jgi:hypothetical protein
LVDPADGRPIVQIDRRAIVIYVRDCVSATVVERVHVAQFPRGRWCCVVTLHERDDDIGRERTAQGRAAEHSANLAATIRPRKAPGNRRLDRQTKPVSHEAIPGCIRAMPTRIGHESQVGGAPRWLPLHQKPQVPGLRARSAPDGSPPSREPGQPQPDGTLRTSSAGGVPMWGSRPATPSTDGVRRASLARPP